MAAVLLDPLSLPFAYPLQAGSNRNGEFPRRNIDWFTRAVTVIFTHPGAAPFRTQRIARRRHVSFRRIVLLASLGQKRLRQSVCGFARTTGSVSHTPNVAVTFLFERMVNYVGGWDALASPSNNRRRTAEKLKLDKKKKEKIERTLFACRG